MFFEAKCASASKIPVISNLKNPACASKRDVLELATLWYFSLNVQPEIKILNGLYNMYAPISPDCTVDTLKSVTVRDAT